MRTLHTTHIQDGGKCIYLKVTIHEHRSDGGLLEGCSSLKEDEKASHGNGSLCPSIKCKHCQRHNRPRELSLWLELSFQLNWICIQFSCRLNSSFRLNTLGPLCLWQCFFFNFHLHQFQFWPPGGVTCITSNFGHRTCISWRFGQQLGLLELVTSLATKCCHLH